MDNRSELMREYIEMVLVNLSMKELYQLAGEMLRMELDYFSDEELLEEIDNNYPELLSK